MMSPHVSRGDILPRFNAVTVARRRWGCVMSHAC